MSLAAAIVDFFASFFATAVAVLSIVFLSFAKATCIATAALLVSLLLTSILFGMEGLVLGLDDVVLAPWLWRAAAAGDAKAVRRLISWGANPNWAGHVPQGAVHTGGSSFYFLSDKEAIQGVTPLHIAASKGHLEVAQELLHKNPYIKLTSKDSQGSTPLHVASHSLNPEMIMLLLSVTPGCWEANDGGWTPLLVAMETCVPSKPSPKTAQTETAQTETAESETAPDDEAKLWDRFVEELELDTIADQRSGDREQVVNQLLLYECGSGINNISPMNNLMALQLAIKRKWTSIAYSLIDAGASADVPGTRQTTLALACICAEYDMVWRLVDAGANVDWQGSDGNTALHVCIDLGIGAALRDAPPLSYTHILENTLELLSDGASVDMPNKRLETPLMRAAGGPERAGSLLTIALLFYSPNLEATDAQGSTALIHAIQCDATEAAALLLAAGANPNPPLPHLIALTKKYLTPLQRAVAKGRSGIARLLIKSSADVNAFPPILPNEEKLFKTAKRELLKHFVRSEIIYPKMPPLLHAIFRGRPEMVKLLLDHGADMAETGNTSFESAMHCAKHFKEWRIYRMLARRSKKAAQGHRWAGWRTKRARFALSGPTAGATAEQGAGDEGAEMATPPPVLPPQQPEQDGGHEVIDIDADQQGQQAQSQPCQQVQAVPRFPLLVRLAQAAGWLTQPFRRSGSGEPSQPSSPQPSQHQYEWDACEVVTALPWPAVSSRVPLNWALPSLLCRHPALSLCIRV